ncbi:MAG: ABC transporter permease [Gammaproteobacteria bacterium]
MTRRTPRRFARLYRLVCDPLGLTGLLLVVLFIAGAAFAPYLTPHSPTKIDVPHRLEPPSAQFILGTDQLGRDTFTRVLYGGRVALRVAAIAVSIGLACGLVLGMIAGYGPRWLDNALMLVFDTINSFPAIMLALAIITLTGPSLQMIIVVVVINSIPSYGRIARTQTLSLRHTEFILAERALGAGMVRVLARHVMPNVIGPLLILAAMNVPVVVTIEAGLSFLGLGVRPPTPSWGSILADGRQIIRDTPWPVIAGGLPLIATTIGFTFLGEALRDILDPRLRKAL